MSPGIHLTFVATKFYHLKCLKMSLIQLTAGVVRALKKLQTLFLEPTVLLYSWMIPNDDCQIVRSCQSVLHNLIQG